MTVFTFFSLTVIAQDSSKHKEKMKMKMEQSKYSCPMHADVTSDKPDKCSKCGMYLKKKEMKAYSCPMHSDVVNDQPGKCSKCGMELTVPVKK